MPNSNNFDMEAGIVSSIRLTIDEIAAVAQLRALPFPPYLPDEADALSDSGTRSLIARDLLRVDLNGNLTLPAMIQNLVSDICACQRFIVLSRNNGRIPAQVGRAVVPTSGPAIVEEMVYPGVYGFTPLAADALSEFLRMAFQITANSTSNPDSGDAVTIRLTMTADDNNQPVLPESWLEPQVNSLILFDGIGRRSRAFAWVAEAGNLWLLEPHQAAEPGSRAFAMTASALGLNSLVTRIDEIVSLATG